MATLNWIGKDAVVNHDKEVPFKLLEKVTGMSLGMESENLVIHGDNLEALKALIPFYKGKIKCIYIDPPYNTGKEKWIYNDKVNSPKIREWLGKTVGPESEDLTRHDKWLCMMYPRMKLLRDLLREDGAIFVSIDDNEVQSLRFIMDEIFGRQNFVTQFIWNTEGHTDNQFHVKVNHEYVVLYSFNKKKLRLENVVDPNTREESNLWAGFAENSITKNGPGNPPSEITLPKGFPSSVDSLHLKASTVPPGLIERMKKSELTSNQLKAEFGKVQFPLRLDDMDVKNGVLTKSCRVLSGWANANKLRAFIKNECKPIDDDGGQIRFYISENGVIYYRKERGDNASHILSVLRNLGTTEKMRSELESMGVTFQYPKPKELIKYLIKIGSGENDLVLDSFAGSGTTGHAVMELNKERGNRKFVLIEMEDVVARKIATERLKKIAKITDSTGFEFVELGRPLFNEKGQINEDCTYEELATYIYFTETHTNAVKKNIKAPLVGESNGTSYYLLYTGKNKNDLTREALAKLKITGPAVIYADRCLVDEDELASKGITFKQIPYEIKVY